MKHIYQTLLFGGLIAAGSSCVPESELHNKSGPKAYAPATTQATPGPRPTYYQAAPASAAGQPRPDGYAERWPAVLVGGTNTITLYEPQIDFWDGSHLIGRQAVAIQSNSDAQPNYAVVTLKAITLVDKTTRTVTLDNIEFSGGDFSTAPQRALEYMRLLREKVAPQFPKLALARLENSFVTSRSALHESAQPLNNTPPEILTSTKPAILVLLDGPPVFRLVVGTELQRAINTHVLLLKGNHDQLYLHLWDGYVTASSLDGPWTMANTPPPGAATAEQEARMNALDLLEADNQATQIPSLTNSPAPVVYARTAPAELISFQGEPNFVPIPNTHLLYASNTSANVFKLLTDQQTYVLISGRWYRAGSPNGPWHFVPANELAADFKNIPDDSPKENVKASVPGTQQANEALLANAIPQSSKVPRNLEMQNPQIDGEPKLQPIKGTPLSYVANSATAILKVDDNSWYACQNGVWFSSTSVTGPWVVATSVPRVIYSIPPDSPMHYLTYVQVYGSTPQYVYDGYTPGYMGTEVQDGVVVYGTGYYYPPWVGTVWYGGPCTWGYGWGPCWNPWYGWSFYCGFGWGWYGCFPPYPYWGPYYHCHYYGHYYGHWHGGLVASHSTGISTAHSVYTTTRAGATAATTTKSGAAPDTSRYAQAYNSRTGNIAAGQRASVQNVYHQMGATGGAQTGTAMNRTAGGARGAQGWHGQDMYGTRGYSGSSGAYYHGGYMGGSAGYYRGPGYGYRGYGGYAPGMYSGHGGGGYGGYSGGHPGGGGGHGGGHP